MRPLRGDPSAYAVLLIEAYTLRVRTDQTQPPDPRGMRPDFPDFGKCMGRGARARHGLLGSISRKGKCWDNAVMKRFFLNLKTERVWQRDYANHAEATSYIADDIVSFYNRVRLHSELANLPPNAFEHQSAITQAIGVCEIT